MVALISERTAKGIGGTMELLESGNNDFTIKLDWKHDLNVIFVVLMAVSKKYKDLDKEIANLTKEEVDGLKKHFLTTRKKTFSRKKQAREAES